MTHGGAPFPVKLAGNYVYVAHFPTNVARRESALFKLRFRFLISYSKTTIMTKIPLLERTIKFARGKF